MNEFDHSEDDPLEELRRIREAKAAQFNYDLVALFHDLKEKERLSGHRYVSFSDQPEDPDRRRQMLTPKPRSLGTTGDPIVDEIRQFRDEYAAKFNYDVAAMVRDLQERQRKRDRDCALPPPIVSPEAASPEARLGR